MKKLFLFSLLVIGLISCNKKKECLAQKSDEVWLIIKDSNGVNLLNTLHQSIPITNRLGPTFASSHFDRVIVDNGTDDQMAWKIDLNNISSNYQYEIFTESDTFLLELEWSLEDTDCNYKAYKGRKLNWLNFEDTTFYSPGILTYIDL